MQEQVNVPQQSTEQSSVEDLKKKFEEVKTQTRWVRVLYKSCCGCGCSEVELYRKVDANSNLKDGDRVKEWLDGDLDGHYYDYYKENGYFK